MYPDQLVMSNFFPDPCTENPTPPFEQVEPTDNKILVKQGMALLGGADFGYLSQWANQKWYPHRIKVVDLSCKGAVSRFYGADDLNPWGPCLGLYESMSDS